MLTSDRDYDRVALADEQGTGVYVAVLASKGDT